jgi:hypothetical protein
LLLSPCASYGGTAAHMFRCEAVHDQSWAGCTATSWPVMWDANSVISSL